MSTSFNPSFGLAIRGRLGAYMEAQEEALAVAATAVFRRKQGQLKKNMRNHIARKFSGSGGERLSKDLEVLTYPRTGDSMTPAVQAFTKTGRAQRKSRGTGRFFDAISFFSEGGKPKLRNASWLAIPTEEGRRLDRGPRNAPRLLTPRRFRESRLQFIPGNRRNRARLVLKNRPDVTVFVLMKPKRLRRRIRLEPIHRRVGKNIPDLVVGRYEREVTRRWRRLDRQR